MAGPTAHDDHAHPRTASHDDAHGHHDHKPGFFARWFLSTNHKDIGTLYLIFAIMAGIVGGLMSVAMRMTTDSPPPMMPAMIAKIR